MKGLLLALLIWPWGLTAWGQEPIAMTSSQKAVIEESLTDVVCESATHAVAHYKEVTTIQNEQGASLANFVCACSKNDKLSDFKGQVVDASGKVIRKFKESDLKRTEYSPYLAIDDYQMYLEYTPPTYPITIIYEWTMDSRDNLIEFPRFCPLSDYDVALKKAVYRLAFPKDMQIRHALKNIAQDVSITQVSQDTQLLTLELTDLPAFQEETYARPLHERLPIAYFAPTDFVYYGTKGSLRNWNDYGKWEYSLIEGSDALPETLRQKLHQLTDNLTSKREKVEALYHELEKTTRYVAVLLGIGGQKPMPAATVSKSGFGDCKGLSNYMRAMLKEIGIASNYIPISTTNRRLLPDFASAGQMNHVILQVPLEKDTLWLECTNPQLPLGYVHEDIAGHDAIEVNEHGGRLMRLPVYEDSTNLMRSNIHIQLDQTGAADISFKRTAHNRQYEHYLPLVKMDHKEQKQTMNRMMRIPQAEISNLDIRSLKSGAVLSLEANIRSQKYATKTGLRLFVPLNPGLNSYTIPSANSNRQERIWIKMGYLDEDHISLTIPEGYEIEALPKGEKIEKPFGTFDSSIQTDGQEIRVTYRLFMKSGDYDKSLFPELTDFLKTANKAYNQRIVIKKSSQPST